MLHLAAFFRGATEAEARAVNLDGTVALAQSCVATGVPRLLFASTNLVYGPDRGRPARESDPPAPVGAYPISKEEAEQALLDVPGLDVCVLRLAFVYADGDPHLAEAIPFWRKFLPGERIHLVHHADVAQAFGRALEAPYRRERIFEPPRPEGRRFRRETRGMCHGCKDPGSRSPDWSRLSQRQLWRGSAATTP